MMGLKTLLKTIPVIGPFIKRMRAPALVASSAEYWEGRYRSGGHSGAGSYNRLAQFKADIINEYVKDRCIHSVIEFGSGDGSQLQLAKYPDYLGVDVSKTVVEMARRKFAGVEGVAFVLASDFHADKRADLALSLDVIYHLVEDHVFDSYMRQLFNSAKKAVIIYSSNKEEIAAAHVRHRKFTDWVKANAKHFILVKYVPNRYPFDSEDPDNTSFADFYIFETEEK